MSTVVFYLDQCGNAQAEHFTDLGLALARTEELRNTAQITHTTISSELPESVGRRGVSAVEGGKTPDGSDYTWSKAHRGRR